MQAMTWSVIAVILVPLAAGAKQTTPALSSLTVSEANLPKDCKPRVYAPPSTQFVFAGSTVIVSNPAGRGLQPFPSNPWVGTNEKLVGDLHARFMTPGARKRVPDGPPLTQRELSALLAHQNRPPLHVVEGYRAIYETTFDGEIEVAAIRFDDGKFATFPEPSVTSMLRTPTRTGVHERVVRGAVLADVRAQSTNDCFRAIAAHVSGAR